MITAPIFKRCFEFQSTPSVGRATTSSSGKSPARAAFQSTPSVGRATIRAGIMQSTNGISIHALRGEGDENIEAAGCPVDIISIHALRGEGDYKRNGRSDNKDISIHALRGEGDKYIVTDGPLDFDFNPRPPWGGRLKHIATMKPVKEFQSTPSVGRAT